MRIALVQQHATREKAENVARGLAAFEAAARQGAGVVGFAELAFEWFHPQRPAGAADVGALAEPIEGQTVRAFQTKARELGVVAILNMFEEREFAEAAGRLVEERIDSRHLKDESAVGTICRAFVTH